MLHGRPAHVAEFLEGAGERDLFPATWVAADTETVGGAVRRREPQAVVRFRFSFGLEGLVAADGEVIAACGNVRVISIGDCEGALPT